MIDVSSRRPPDRLAAARAAHGELESEGVQRSWPPDRFAAALAAPGRPIASPPLGRRVESSSRRACSAAGRPPAPPPPRRATAEQPSRGARAGRVVRRSKPRSQSPLAQSRPRVRDASGRRPTRQARYCSVAEPTAAERSAKQPTALEPLARPSSRATARRARAARGSSRPSPSPTSRSRPLEITKIAVSSRGEPSVGGGGAVRGATRPAQATTA